MDTTCDYYAGTDDERAEKVAAAVARNNLPEALRFYPQELRDQERAAGTNTHRRTLGRHEGTPRRMEDELDRAPLHIRLAWDRRNNAGAAK